MNPETAKIRKAAVEKFIAGDRVATIMKWLATEKSVTNPATGKHFTWGGTKTMVLSPRNWGVRTYNDEIIYDDNGEIVRGNWEAIFETLDTWYQVQALKGRDANLVTSESAVSYLLTGIARCGRCGGGLKGKPKWKKGERTPVYVYNCNKQRPEQCGALSIDGPKLDDMIREFVWAQVLRASKALTSPAPTEPWEGEAALKGVEAELKELQTLWGAQKVTAGSYAITRDDLIERKNKLLVQQATHFVPAGTRAITEELLATGWDGLSIERQRKIIRKVLRAVMIHPAKSPGGSVRS
ncbi:recombinase zinc beta ribbon domain-containing protein [Streptomyces sp. NPDC056105]|uniref:recombinase zinc beta ribbon domain-containing protein n=1 Tax=Streptomyces sp. NPDC056105 TaxID=3345714 RepID=UPI0035D9BF05